MKIYTKTGDKGETSLSDGTRVKKTDLRVETYGAADETNSVLGVAIAHDPPQPIKDDLTQIQRLLFKLGSDLATPKGSRIESKIERISENDVIFLEQKIDEYDRELNPLKKFILLGGSKPSGFIHQARAVCRRTERLAVALNEIGGCSDETVKFLNRLSDYFFTAARYANKLLGAEEEVL